MGGDEFDDTTHSFEGVFGVIAKAVLVPGGAAVRRHQPWARVVVAIVTGARATASTIALEAGIEVELWGWLRPVGVVQAEVLRRFVVPWVILTWLEFAAARVGREDSWFTCPERLGIAEPSTWGFHKQRLCSLRHLG